MRRDHEASAREDILRRINQALRSPASANLSVEESWANLPRRYRRSSNASPSTILDLLVDRLHDYDAQVLRTPVQSVPQAVGKLLAARGVSTMLIPAGVPQSFLPRGLNFVSDTDLSSSELDRCDGVLTTCTLAIAETGTIVLQNAPGQGRRTVSLVPDYHLCLVAAEHVVATVPEAMAALQKTLTLPTTFISGPSATADIEMTRIKGVHGPRFLDVVLME